jgi:predicted nucleic acid-binding protein
VLFLKIYIDNCCYNRPFDDHSQERIYLESEAVLSILKRVEKQQFELFGSPVLQLEISRMRDDDKQQKVRNLYHLVNKEIAYTSEVKKRSEEIMSLSNIRSFDSLHIAIAEQENIDVLLTTDDKLEKMAANLDLKVTVQNPLKFILEVL